MLFIYFLLITPYSLCAPACLTHPAFSLTISYCQCSPVALKLLTHSVSLFFSFSATFLPKLDAGLPFEASLTLTCSHRQLPPGCWFSLICTSWTEVHPCDFPWPTMWVEVPFATPRGKLSMASISCLDLLSVMGTSGVAELCLHPRTRSKWKRGPCQREIST